MKVMLIDSNIITSSRIASMLKRHGWEIIQVSDTKKIKETLESDAHISTCLINLEAPNGIEFLSAIKSITKELKVVAYCGHKNINLRQRAKELGADEVIPNSQIHLLTQLIGP